MPNQRTYRKGLGIVFYVTLQLIVLGCNQRKSTKLEVTSPTIDSVRFFIAQSKLLERSDLKKSQLLHQASQKVPKIAGDSLKCKYFTKISLQLTYTNDTTQFRSLNRKAFQLAERIKDSSSLSSLHWHLGDYFKNTSLKDSAFYHFSKAEKMFAALGDNVSGGKALYNMARVQNRIGDYTGSDITATKAIIKFKPLNRFEDLYKSYSLLGDNAKLLSEYDRSLDHYNDALEYLKRSNGSLIREIAINNNIGLVYQKKGVHEKAITHFNKVLDFDNLRQNSPFLYGRALNNLGYSYLKINNLEQLHMLFSKVIRFQDSIGDIGGKASSTHRLAEYFLCTKDTTNALAYLEIAKTYASQQSNNKRLVEILRMFPKVDPKNANRHAEAAFSLNDSLQILERQIRNKFARIEFETEEVNAENQLLARQKQLWTGIAVALMLLSLSAYIIIRQRNKNQKLQFKEQQQASNQEIFNLLLAQNEKVEEGKKLEQKRVSEELHDGVLGRMLGTRMMLLGLNKRTEPEAIAERAKAIAILQEVEREVRTISHELSHAAYQKIHNFILSIEDLLKTVENTSTINVDFNYADGLDYDTLNGDIKINLYRVIQESIQNAVKHAKCKNIHVYFGKNEKDLKVVIADDGKGFVVKKSKKGIGTRNITSRVKKMNGIWRIDSVIGKGTTIELIIPIVTNDNSSNLKLMQEEVQEL